MGILPTLRFARKRPPNPLNTVFSNVPSLNELERPFITFGINGERPMTSLSPGHSSCWVKPSSRKKMTLPGSKGTMQGASPTSNNCLISFATSSSTSFGRREIKEREGGGKKSRPPAAEEAERTCSSCSQEDSWTEPNCRSLITLSFPSSFFSMSLWLSMVLQFPLLLVAFFFFSFFFNGEVFFFSSLKISPSLGLLLHCL